MRVTGPNTLKFKPPLNGAPLSVALVQGNIDQQLKWREDQRAATLDNYFELFDPIYFKIFWKSQK